MSILTTTNVTFSIIRSLITKLLQPRKETTATTVFSKGHDPKNVTPTLYKGNIFTLLWKEIIAQVLYLPIKTYI